MSKDSQLWYLKKKWSAYKPTPPTINLKKIPKNLGLYASTYGIRRATLEVHKIEVEAAYNCFATSCFFTGYNNECFLLICQKDQGLIKYKPFSYFFLIPPAKVCPTYFCPS